jgi:2-polyprenyl-3-methyl-5-hydroxy-6-metoxy-1,4-benzoquinol methylase
MPKYIKCNLCGGEETIVIQKAEELYSVVKCRSCGLVYVNPQPAQEELVNFYGEEYYREWTERQKNVRTFLWRKRLKDLVKYKEKKSEGQAPALLDVGCGNGEFLEMAKATYQIHGTEISPFAVEYVNRNLGTKVHMGNLSELNLLPNTYDVITIWHTLEHMPDPLENLKEAKQILKDDGLLIIEVPNMNAYIERAIYRVVKRKQERFFSIYDREPHLFHFTPSTLKDILKRAGFQVVKCGPEVSHVLWQKKIVEYLGIIVHHLTGINVGSTIRVYASKAD